jgi:hypothetical protein
MVGPWLDKPYTFLVLRKTFGQMWLRCDVCRRYARLKIAGLLDIDYRKKIQRLAIALNNPKDRAEAAEATVAWLTRLPCGQAPIGAKSTQPCTASWARSWVGSKREPLEMLKNAALPQLALR